MTASPDLPIVTGRLPEADEDDIVVFVGCDAAYARDHLPALAGSIAANAPATRLHVHLVDAEPATEDALATLDTVLRRIALSWTMERSPPALDRAGRRAYYAAIRFVRLWQVAGAVPARFVLLDADSLVRAPLGVLCGPAGAADVGLYLCPTAPAHMRVKAGLVLIEPTEAGHAFAHRVAVDIAAALARGEARWFLDQRALDRALVPSLGLRVRAFDPPALDWEFTDDTAVWTAKGARKSDARFCAAAAAFARRADPAQLWEAA